MRSLIETTPNDSAGRRLVRGAILCAFAVCATLTAPALARAAADKAQATDPDSVLAHVNLRVLGKTQFANEWSYMNPSLRPPGDPLTARRAYLDQLVDRMLIGDAALARHYTWTAAESLDYRRVTRRARKVVEQVFWGFKQ